MPHHPLAPGADEFAPGVFICPEFVDARCKMKGVTRLEFEGVQAVSYKLRAATSRGGDHRAARGHRFVVQFQTPLKDEDLGTPPFDPFLFVNGDRGREIHLIGKSPTDAADVSLFGAADDAGGYATQSGLPWAILVPEFWPWPSERTPVNEAHLEFVPWAESGGTLYTDWFTSKGSNRNSAKLISP